MQKELLVALGLVAGLTTGVGVWAQSSSDAAAKDDELQEVVVTAEKRTENLQKVSESIEVKTGQQLREEGKSRIDDIMKGTVGVAAQDSQVGVSFTIRGVASVEGGPPGGAITGTSIPVVIDGVTQSRGETVRGGTLDLAQAEIMRGPQSTNLGSGALAGAIGLVTNNPVFRYEANGQIEAGNFNLLNYQGVLNIPLSDSQAVRFAYSHEKRDGYISSGAGDSDQSDARVKYRWQVNENLNVVVTGNHQEIGGNGVQAGVLLSSGRWIPYNGSYTTTGGQTLASYSAANGCAAPSTVTVNGVTYPVTTYMGCAPSYIAIDDGVTFRNRKDAWNDGYPANAWPNQPFRNTKINTLSANVDWNLGFGTLSFLPSFQSARFLSEEPPRGTSYMEQNQPQETSQAELRLASPDDSKLQWLAGLYYYYTDMSGTFENVSYPGDMSCPYSSTSGISNCETWSDTAYTNQTTYSAFGNFKYPIIDTLRLIGGVRYSQDRKAFSSNQAPPGTGVGPPYSAPGDVNGPSVAYYFNPEAAHTFHATTYRAGFEWDIVPEAMAYATVSTGYQPGTITWNEPTAGPVYAAGPGTVTVNPSLKLDQYTLGLKSRWFDNKLQANVEVFDSEFHNRTLEGTLSTNIPGGANPALNCGVAGGGPPGGSGPSLTVDSAADCVIVNQNNATVPKLTTRGADFEFALVPTANDRLDLTVEYDKATYQSTPQLGGETMSQATLLSIIQANSPTATSANQQALAGALWNTLNSLHGAVVQNAPTVSVNATYQHAFTMPGGSRLTPKVNYIYKTKYWSFGGAPGANITAILADTSNIAWQQAYSWVDAYLTWEKADGKFSVNGYVKNVGNQVVLTNYGGSYASLDAPRTYGVIVQANF